VAVGLILACWITSEHFFGSPTTDFNTDYDFGVFALLEQALAAFATPAAFAADIFGIGFGVPSRGLFLCRIVAGVCSLYPPLVASFPPLTSSYHRLLCFTHPPRRYLVLPVSLFMAAILSRLRLWQ